MLCRGIWRRQAKPTPSNCSASIAALTELTRRPRISGETLVILKHLREGQEKPAIYNLEQRLSRYAGLMCNCYGGLYPSNREEVKLESLQQTRDYFAKYPHPEWGTGREMQVNEVLRLASEKRKE